MLQIIGTQIRLTRGDTAYLTVSLTGPDGAPYELDPADTLVFSVKRFASDAKYAFQKTAAGSGQFKILPEDTAGLSFAPYKYDVQATKANGDVCTVVPSSVFEILEEVTV